MAECMVFLNDGGGYCCWRKRSGNYGRLQTTEAHGAVHSWLNVRYKSVIVKMDSI
jgi:hypothetical protein